MALRVVVALALLQAGQAIVIGSDHAEPIPAKTSDHFKQGWALFKSKHHGKADQTPMCDAESEFFLKYLQPHLPKEMKKQVHPLEGSSLLQMDQDQDEHTSGDYIIPTFEFVNQPFGKATEESFHVGEKEGEIDAMSLLEEKELMSQVLGPKHAGPRTLKGKFGGPSHSSPSVGERGRHSLTTQMKQQSGRKYAKEPAENIEAYRTYSKWEPERASCAGAQLKESLEQHGMKMHSFMVDGGFPDKCTDSALNGQWTVRDKAKFKACLQEEGFGDCVSAGTGGLASRDLSRWCGHKRMFKKLSESNTSAEYFVLVGDTNVLDRQFFMPVIQDFVGFTKQNNMDWDLVQLDPHGAKNKEDIIQHLHGKPIFKVTHNKKSNDCRGYLGFHTVLVKKSALPRILSFMSSNPAMEMSKFARALPRTLSYSGLISRSTDDTGLDHHTIKVPSYCSEQILASTTLVSKLPVKTDFPEIASAIPDMSELQREFMIAESHHEASNRQWERLVSLSSDLHEAADKNMEEVKSEFKASRASLDEMEERMVQTKKELKQAKKELDAMKAETEESEHSRPADLGDIQEEPLMQDALAKVEKITNEVDSMKTKLDELRDETATKLELVAKAQLKIGAIETFGKSLFSSPSGEGSVRPGPAGPAHDKIDFKIMNPDVDASSIVQLGEEPAEKARSVSSSEDLNNEMIDLHHEMSKLNILPDTRRHRKNFLSSSFVEMEKPHFAMNAEALQDLRNKYKFPALFKALHAAEKKDHGAARIAMEI